MRLGDSFFSEDVLVVAPALVGKVLWCRDDSGTAHGGRIAETEAYRGEDDSACHARFGRTKRSETLYLAGGHAYVYLCYGVHHLFNVVTGEEDKPQAALIRALTPVPDSPDWAAFQYSMSGPGRLTKFLGITMSDNRADLRLSPRIWLDDDGYQPDRIDAASRIGINYASPDDQARPWRFTDATFTG